jgi:hypothetical protein
MLVLFPTKNCPFIADPVVHSPTVLNAYTPNNKCTLVQSHKFIANIHSSSTSYSPTIPNAYTPNSKCTLV